jgi:hypothetical protein
VSKAAVVDDPGGTGGGSFTTGSRVWLIIGVVALIAGTG